MNLSQVKVENLDILNNAFAASIGVIVWGRSQNSVLSSVKENFEKASYHIEVISSHDFQYSTESVGIIKKRILAAHAQSQKVVIVFNNLSDSKTDFSDFLFNTLSTRMVDSLPLQASDVLVATGFVDSNGNSLNGNVPSAILNKLYHVFLDS